MLRTAAVAGFAGVAGCTMPSTTQDDADDFDTVRVPDDQPTVQDGVDAAGAGDLVLVEPGTYEETVDVTTPGLTIRGIDRNDVVLDGAFERAYGIHVEADGVALENMTARHYTGTAFYWTDVEGFRGSYLTAYNDGTYGIYAYRSRDGRFEHSYASGHPDAGFYLGRNHPFDAVVSNVVAEYNDMGYSGTSAGGNLTIRDSTWRHNRVGIVPNTLDERDSPQRSAHVVGNEVYENDELDAPSIYAPFGAGILVWGGRENLIEDNEVRDHEHFGIVAQHNVVEPAGNAVRGNDVSGSGTADLALGTPAGDDNRFVDNEFSSSLPENIERDASDGDERVTEVFERQERRAERGDVPVGDWREAPIPDDRPTMADPEAPPRPADRSTSWEE
ncbi:nitrous oxide reductase family maturation protein NosD [Natribaculum luteum]|uniref:Nitrous oxide reductase family maturation protein NosD n=1 Tax=Natribaculum luteum TaxID=1586232 RepID=A0ABD5P1L7_9EURY|nr:right-handed parallel beta-helix repeat-containing protein [Natribaculum luteum]